MSQNKLAAGAVGYTDSTYFIYVARLCVFSLAHREGSDCFGKSGTNLP